VRGTDPAGKFFKSQRAVTADRIGDDIVEDLTVVGRAE
jgi:hypothetical protein